MLLVAGSVFLRVGAENDYRVINRQVDSLLNMRDAKKKQENFDTAYIDKTNNKWTVMGALNVSGADLTAKGKENGVPFTAKMTSDYCSTLSLSVNYRGLGVSLGINPAKWMGKYRDSEFNFVTYGKRFGLELFYQNSHNFTGYHDAEGEPRVDLPSDLLSLKSLNLNTYFVFSPRKFSYPAAFSYNYLQRRSAGSFLLALSGQGQKGEVEGENNARFQMTNVGIGAGYGYNYVPSKGWLLHLSALPTFIVYTNTSLSVNGNRVPLHYHFPETIITGRGAIIRQWDKMFAGASMVFNFTNVGNEATLSIQNTKWSSHAFIGFRL